MRTQLMTRVKMEWLLVTLVISTLFSSVIVGTFAQEDVSPVETPPAEPPPDELIWPTATYVWEPAPGGPDYYQMEVQYDGVAGPTEILPVQIPPDTVDYTGSIPELVGKQVVPFTIDFSKLPRFQGYTGDRIQVRFNVQAFSNHPDVGPGPKSEWSGWAVVRKVLGRAGKAYIFNLKL